jgi:hypothetical protein
MAGRATINSKKETDHRPFSRYPTRTEIAVFDWLCRGIRYVRDDFYNQDVAHTFSSGGLCVCCLHHHRCISCTGRRWITRHHRDATCEELLMEWSIVDSEINILFDSAAAVSYCDGSTLSVRIFRLRLRRRYLWCGAICIC